MPWIASSGGAAEEAATSGRSTVAVSDIGSLAGFGSVGRRKLGGRHAGRP